MAMVNCAFLLAKEGKRVLMVDFDLEAPGIDAFLHHYGARESKGLVDFITDYRATRKAPNVSNYVYEAGPPGARLTVMPAGRRDEAYPRRLNDIDWGQLYLAEDGYLLFEDLKAQWENYIGPDYVFIDSRTGHTDVSGICTRQLPNAVVLLFRLDPQNLDGLSPIVRSIRAEADGPRNAIIHLHFVPSNVPDLDDEGRILEKQIGRFSKQLSHEKFDPRIHHYADLEMLEHRIFAVERKESRLSKEYEILVASIIRENTDDIDGARDFLETAIKTDPQRRGFSSSVVEKIDQIASKNWNDEKILNLLATVRRRQGRFREAISYLSDLIVSAPTDADSFTRRAELHAIVGNNDATRDDLRHALRNSAKGYSSIFRIVSMIQQIEPELVGLLPGSKAVLSIPLQDQVRIAEVIFRFSGSASTTLKVLEAVIENEESNTALVSQARSSSIVPLISEGKFSTAIESLKDPSGIYEEFHLAMALWGDEWEIPTKQFHRVRDLDPKDEEDRYHATLEFYLALAYWATGDTEVAKNRLTRAKELLTHRFPSFSAWRYQFVDREEFLDDLREAEQLFDGGDVVPIVFRAHHLKDVDLHV